MIAAGLPIATFPFWHSGLLLAAAVTPLVAALAVRRTGSVAGVWRTARAATVVMLGAAVAVTIARAFTAERANGLLRSDTIGAAIVVLVAFVGWVVVRYSQSYLRGDPYERRYVVRLLATIGAVAAVVITNHLVVLVGAWAATSLALHGLLTFFGDRPVAVGVAHKKFVLARLADLSMTGAIVAFGTTFDTLRIDRIVTAAAVEPLSGGARIGILLVAVAALLKCAQLPFHGWLIQVMEAPTPVSALLHAGVVNLGGLVLLRFAPVVDRAVETRALLVIFGSVTAVIAALVMTTRISIKVSLAWSTCAQMGFMLLQCGLGLWEMALLHLLAHSLYKAHAFLSAGGVVRQTQRKQLAASGPRPTAGGVATAATVALVGTLAAGWLWGRLPFSEPPSATMWVMSGIVGLAVVPLLGGEAGRGARRMLDTVARVQPAQVIGVVAVPIAYFALHDLAGRLVPFGSAAPAGLLVVVAGLFASLFVIQAICTIAPDGRLSRRLYPWIYGGLFIDEAFTRVVFARWAPGAPAERPAALPRVESIPVFSRPAADRSLV